MSSHSHAHADGSGRSPLKSARGSHRSREEKLVQRARSLAEHGDERRQAGWFQNETYGVVTLMVTV